MDEPKMTSREYLDPLNPPQLRAVEHREGPLLILAGAGSGKTRVITNRIAHLILSGAVAPDRIVAVTFTNRAADEMRQRVADILARADHDRPEERAAAPTLSTFHSLGARLLRWHAERVGRTRQFTILDQDDQLGLVKEVSERHERDADHAERKRLRRYIERMKNRAFEPDEAYEQTRNEREEEDARFYEQYQEHARRTNVVDFGDLLLLPLKMFRADPDLADRYSHRWQYVMVDEFQDTNPAQYELLEHLTTRHRNLAVVGDDDQSIYRWRDATVANILDFEDDFEETEVVKLEQNYRSTELILEAADDIIQHNAERRPKKLWTEKDRGPKITLFTGRDDREEAAYVADEIKSLGRKGADWSDLAIFYRTNAQGRQFEEQLRGLGIPYRVVGGTSFYNRAEIKDVLAYLQVAMNPSDDVSALRVVGTPKRGVGDVTVDKLRNASRVHGIDSAFDAMRVVADQTDRAGVGLDRIEPNPRDDGQLEALAAIEDLGGRPKGGIKEFVELVIDLREQIAQEDDLSELVARLIERINYFDHLDAKDPDRAQDRKENVQELLVALREFEEDGEVPIDEKSPVEDPASTPEDGVLARSKAGRQLRGFLERTSLVQDTDDETSADTVTLMTVHSAKGLEFDTVFLVGMEDELFPNVRDEGDQAELNEERRLAYVAITRTERKLYITNARRRRIWGQTRRTAPSRFLLDIDEDRIEHDPKSCTDEINYGRTRRQRGWGRNSGSSNWSNSGASSSSSSDPMSQVNPDADDHDFVDPDWSDVQADPPDLEAEPATGSGHNLVGKTVSHSRFGIGKVEDVSGEGDDARLTIEFVQSGRKTVIRKYVKIL
jgi:DNA helicase-2/ATP-dependent DNA helicase PcrA